MNRVDLSKRIEIQEARRMYHSKGQTEPNYVTPTDRPNHPLLLLSYNTKYCMPG
jgi:hypothetical protein